MHTDRDSQFIACRIEPLLYRVLRVGTPAYRTQIAVACSKSRPFLQKAVRHVTIYDYTPQMQPLLAKCDGVTDIVLLHLTEGILDAIQHMRPTRLSFFCRWLNFPCLRSFDHSLFTNVTHLHVFHRSPEDLQNPWATWTSLTSLPKLTHLALCPTWAKQILPPVVTDCPKISLLLICFWTVGGTLADAENFSKTLTVADPRIAVKWHPDYLQEWGDGAPSGDDFWARGERFLERKRKGEIPSTSRHPILQSMTTENLSRHALLDRRFRGVERSSAPGKSENGAQNLCIARTEYHAAVESASMHTSRMKFLTPLTAGSTHV